MTLNLVVCMHLTLLGCLLSAYFHSYLKIFKIFYILLLSNIQLKEVKQIRNVHATKIPKLVEQYQTTTVIYVHQQLPIFRQTSSMKGLCSPFIYHGI